MDINRKEKMRFYNCLTGKKYFPNWEKSFSQRGTYFQGTYVHWLTNICSLAHEHMFMDKRTYVLRMMMVLLMMMGVSGVWGQTDYSGTYYIAFPGKVTTPSLGYNQSTPKTNYYLCPTEDWIYYNATDTYTTSDNGQPFLTTYQCRNGIYDVDKAMWTLIKQGDFYQIKHTIDNKYLVYNGKITNGTTTTGSANRIRVHLESTNEPGENALFKIEPDGNHSGYFFISSKGETNQWLNLTEGNNNSLGGTTAKKDGPTDCPNVGNTIGRWNEKNNTGMCLFEKVVPKIFYNTSNKIEITHIDNTATIYYTTNGEEPPTSGTEHIYDGTPFDPADDVTTIKALAVVNGEASGVATFIPPVLLGSTHKRLIQSQNNAWNSTDFHFYMIPGDEVNSVLKVNTTSLFRPSMEWYFMSAGVESGVQYYYIVNNTNSKYLCYDATNEVYMDTYVSENADKFKFSIVESPTAGTYNIKPYGQSNYLNKNTNNANVGAINLNNNNSSGNTRWKFIKPSSLDKDAPFLITDATHASYYKIANVNGNGYYIIPGATNVITSQSTDAAVNWYFEVAQAETSDDWLTYYHIRNAVTGDYLYFTKDGNNAGACLEMRSTIESGNEERYMFTWARTATQDTYYIIPKLLKDVSQNQFSSLRKHDDNTRIITNVTRSADKFAWTFELSDFNCAQPEITWSASDGGYVVTSTESDTKIYYSTTLGEGVLTPSNGTLYTGAIPVADLGVESATIRVIAARNSDGSDASPEAGLTVNRVATPNKEIADDGKIRLISATPGTVIYYTIGDNANITDPTTSSTLYKNPIEVTPGQYIKAIAVKGGWITSEIYESGSVTLQCASPVISRGSAQQTFRLTCGFPEGAQIYYTTDGSITDDAFRNNPSGVGVGTLYTPNSEISFASEEVTVRAIAVCSGYDNSAMVTKTVTLDLEGEGTLLSPYLIKSQADFGMFVEKANNEDVTSTYFKLMENVSAGDQITEPFSGIFEAGADANGNFYKISGLTHALFNTLDGGTVKNVILDNVSISSGINVGAICNEATGATRIYNCGVLATNSTVATDEDGYTTITSCSSTISGSGYVGGLVGLLDGSSRVINCFSYANVSGGSHVGGIVGYNNVATTATNLKTMVMNCMFYGEVSGGSIAPIYNGEIITNVGENTGVSNFNYFRLESSYIQNTKITKVYNCALGAETRFLQRFEFFRHLLNSNRELAAWWASTSTTTVIKEEMMKWVMEPSQIGSPMPYPVLKTPGKYASVVNYTPNETAYDEEHRNEGRKLTSIGTDGKLSVTIQSGSGGATGASLTTSSLNLTITDKDFEHFNFNYGKVQLPYYNDVGTKNYTDGKVVTGWKITSITGGTSTGYSTGADVTYNTNGELTATPYNFADRKCTGKDLYGTSGRVFNQGAYWDVPEGVTAITIEPYWGKAVYLGDAYYDVVYNTAMSTASNVTTVGGGQHYDNGVSTFNGQFVYTSMANAVTALNPSGTVYDNAVVLVGNYHEYSGSAQTIRSGKPYTVTSIDLDEDNEPDYSFMWRFDGRTKLHPVRYDFLNLIGLGMAQKSTGGTGSYNFGIPQPLDWFEVTNTALFRVTQFEYSPANRGKKPIILQGGVIEQWVTQQQDAGDRVSYFHVGGNVWFKEFHRGSHQDNAGKSTPHPPVSVTGGDFAKFYLTGLYQSQATIFDDNAECYINGGRFGEMAGAGMEGIGTSNGKGNITWIIDNADIKEFYGGGINYAKPVHGNIHTIISNSYVKQFCGGPKFGDMKSDRTVTTTATNCIFGTYFGAGYGGNSYNRYAPFNKNNVMNIDWNTWVGSEYKQNYNATYSGVSTQIDYQFIPMSGNADNVARLWVEFVGFSLATCRNVTSSMTGCKITGNFYGGGSLGKVEGSVTSILDGCTVKGNVFGAGFSASLPEVEVDSIGFRDEPYYYEDLGTYRTAVKGKTTTYKWKPKTGNKYIDTGLKELYTTEDLSPSNLGSVNGAVTLTLKGDTKVGTLEGSTLKEGTGNVYGGGDASVVNNPTNPTAASTIVSLQGNTQVLGNVFGGGNKGMVSGTTTVKIEE